MESIKRKCEKLFSFSYWLDSIFLIVMETKERREGQFYTVHKRPILESECITDTIHRTKTEPVAIVMQGSLSLKNNITLETAKLYKKYFPETILILSTESDQDPVVLKKIKELGWNLVLNERPLFRGHHNINCQLSTSFAGLQKAKELGAKYAIKTRTDQRMYNKNAIQLFLNLDKLYPPDEDSSQTRRLFLPNLGTLKYRPYGVGDMLMFGHIDDMLEYWGIPQDTRNIQLKDSFSILDTAKTRITEVYIATEYLKKLGYNFDWTLEDTWQVYGKYFCIFDHSLLDLFWYKNIGLHTEFRFHYYNKIHAHEIFQYAEWLGCYNKSIDLKSLPEKILTARDGASL